MSEVTLQTIIILLGGIVVITCLAGTIALFVQASRDKEKRMCLFSAGLFMSILTVAVSLMHFGSVVLARGYTELGAWLENMHFSIAPLAGLVLVAFTAELYLRRHRRLVQALAVMVFVPLLYQFVQLAAGGISTAVLGVHFPAVDTNEMLVKFMPIFVSYTFLAIMSAIAYWKKKQRSDLYLFLSVVVVLVINPTVGFMWMSWHVPAMPFSIIALLLEAVLFSLGVLGKLHKNVRFRREPMKLVTSNISLKMTVISAIFFLLLSFLVAVVVSFFFVRYADEREMENESRVLQGAVSSYQALSDDLISDALHFRRYIIESGDNLELNSSTLSAWTNEYTTNSLFLFEKHSDRAIASINETSLLPVLAGQSALHDIPPEEPRTFIFTDGSEWHSGVALALNKNERSYTLVFTRPLTIEMLAISHTDAGLITPERELTEDQIEWEQNESLDIFWRQALATDGVATGRTKDIYSFHSAALRSASNQVDGVVYQLTRQEVHDKRVLYVMGWAIDFCLYIALVAYMIFFLLLRSVLSPIKKLDEATTKLASGNYDVNIDHDRYDELGRLSDSFNMMARKIQFHTKALDEKIREQRDSLNYVAHELKSPISATGWALEMMKSEELNEDERQDFISRASLTNRRMRQLVSDLLDFARMERGAFKLDLQPVDVRRSVQESVDSLRPLVTARQTQIDLENLPDKLEVRADPDRLKQILENIISNAVKYSPDDGSGRVSISTEQHKKDVVIEITDNGMGIPKTQQPEIFKRFFRADNAVESEMEGTGLGLHLTKNLVKMQDGEIWFKSAEGIGSSFFIRLPRA